MDLLEGALQGTRVELALEQDVLIRKLGCKLDGTGGNMVSDREDEQVRPRLLGNRRVLEELVDCDLPRGASGNDLVRHLGLAREEGLGVEEALGILARQTGSTCNALQSVLRADQDISRRLIARLLVERVCERSSRNEDDGQEDDPLATPKDTQTMLKVALR